MQYWINSGTAIVVLGRWFIMEVSRNFIQSSVDKYKEQALKKQEEEKKKDEQAKIVYNKITAQAVIDKMLKDRESKNR